MTAAEPRGGSKPNLNEALGWIGSRVDDIYGASVGRLEDVWIDPGTGAPRWLLVKECGFGGRTTLIPFEDATAGTGHVWVPYEREVVRDAPEIEAGAPLTHQVEAALRGHFAGHAPGAAPRRAASPSPYGVGRQQGSALGTATVRLHGPSEPAPHAACDDGAPGGSFERGHPPAPRSVPQPHRQILREQRPPDAGPSDLPPYSPAQLPPRPAPPVAAPAPAAPPPMPGWAVPLPAAGGTPARGWQRPPAPEGPDGWAAGSEPRSHLTPPSQEWAPRPEPPGPATGWPEPGPGASSIEALQAIAASAEVHYVEIELSGELSIRGELRSVRVVPRGTGPAFGA